MRLIRSVGDGGVWDQETGNGPMALIAWAIKVVWFITFGWVIWLVRLPFRMAPPASTASPTNIAYEYKTVVLQSTPGFDVSVRKIGKAANKLAKAGWELAGQSQSQTTGFFASQSVTLSFRRPRR